jgi:cell division protein FtsI/penicillin-binding protein 2
LGKVAGRALTTMLLAGVCCALAPLSLPSSSGDLHSQAAAAMLEKEFSSPDISYVLMNAHGDVIAQRWDDPQHEVPIGSLIKPFIALAYGRTHPSFPTYRCAGKKTCWLPRGHGTLGIRDAIALSCNSYFHQLYGQGRPGFARPVLEEFGLDPKTDGSSGIASPLALAHAYLELINESREKAVAPVIEGMALSAKIGTGKAAGQELHGLPVLAKTGTAPCIHSRSVPGDGFAVVVAPRGHPELVLLVRVHGRPGSFAAGIAGKMLAAIEVIEVSR